MLNDIVRSRSQSALVELTPTSTAGCYWAFCTVFAQKVTVAGGQITGAC